MNARERTSELVNRGARAYADGVRLVEVEHGARVEVDRVEAHLGREDDLHALALLDRQVHQARLAQQVCACTRINRKYCTPESCTVYSVHAHAHR